MTNASTAKDTNVHSDSSKHSSEMSDSDQQTQFAEATLAEFGDSWKRPDDFVAEATIVDVTPERCEKHIIRELTACESRETVKIPPSEFETFQEERVQFEERYEPARREFLDETIEYVCQAKSVDTCGKCHGDGTTDCSNCRTGEVQCGTCTGDGMEKCSQCRGWGSTGPSGRISCPDCSGSGTTGSGDSKRSCHSCNGKGHVMCNSCSGNGEHRCTNCGGGGIVTCGVCGGSTVVVCSDCKGECEIVIVDIGEVTFASSSKERGVSSMEVPEAYITSPQGTKFKTEDEWTDVDELDVETRVRREVERRHVDVTRIDYRYDDDEYAVFDVEGTIQAKSYPKSRSRTLIPYVLTVALLILLCYGIYQYVL